jgi:hypothetical protein
MQTAVSQDQIPGLTAGRQLRKPLTERQQIRPVLAILAGAHLIASSFEDESGTEQYTYIQSSDTPHHHACM